MTFSKNQNYLTEKEAAQLLGKLPRWLQNDRYLATRGQKLKIPFVKQDKKILYTKEDILKFKKGIEDLSPPRKKPSSSHVISTKHTMEDKVDARFRELISRVEELERKLITLENKKRKGWLSRFLP